MQPMLAGVARYLDFPDTLILPVGITGTEALFPVDDEALHRARIVIRIGAPLDADALTATAGGDRRVLTDAVGLAIADVLPAAYRGAYGESAPGLAAARQLLQAVQCR